jgi:N-sulfoglucosamine sulfohydrolase
LRVTKRAFIRSAGGLILLAGTSPWTEVLASALSPDKDEPLLNLLFITADDMSGAMPGWMGNPLKPTPNMDAFADKAHRFVKNYGAAPICMPSRQAFMTGLWPNRSGALGFNPVYTGTPTLATVLKEKGYFIAALNKLSHMAPPSCFPWDKSSNDSGKNPPLIGQRVAEVIKAAQAAGKPFFLNCNICDPHRPYYNVPDPHENIALDLEHPFTAEDIQAVPSFLEDLPPIRKEMAQYTNSVKRLDLSFGEALAALQASGEMDRTVLVFVADHGMAVPFSKVTCYRNGSWCPVLLHWPGMGTSQLREEMTQSIDLMPTLLDILGIAKPDMDGRSWMPLLRGESQPDRDYVILNSNSSASGARFPMRAVQTQKSAFVVSFWSNGKNFFSDHGMDTFNGYTYAAMVDAAKTDARIKARVDQLTLGFPLAFYDMVADPDQRVNLISDPVHQAEVKRLQDILMAYMVKTGDPQLENYKTLLAGGTVNIDVNPPGKSAKASE